MIEATVVDLPFESIFVVIGAREGIPVVKRGDQLPEDLDFGVRDLVINPAEDVLRFIGGDDDEGFVYPLRKGGEQELTRPPEDVTQHVALLYRSG